MKTAPVSVEMMRRQAASGSRPAKGRAPFRNRAPSLRLPVEGALHASLSLGRAILIVAMCATLALVLMGIVWAWDATNGVDDAAMDENGWIALGLGSTPRCF
jgi:hypothetical protein